VSAQVLELVAEVGELLFKARALVVGERVPVGEQEELELVGAALALQALLLPQALGLEVLAQRGLAQHLLAQLLLVALEEVSGQGRGASQEREAAADEEREWDHVVVLHVVAPVRGAVS
jgi:hypothetical protein